jgi:GNAT superfamily N-acetyltransferase
MRDATESDIDDILKMGAEFTDALGVIYDPESALKTAKWLMDADDGVLLIDEGAMAGALIYPHFFNQGRKIAQELFWWVSEPYRGNGVAMQLLRGLEDWAKNNGASALHMVAMNELGNVGQIYERRGYKPLEQTYMKEF